MYTTGACKKLIMVSAKSTKKSTAQKIDMREREISIWPVCQLRTKRKEKTNLMKLIDGLIKLHFRKKIPTYSQGFSPALASRFFPHLYLGA